MPRPLLFLSVAAALVVLYGVFVGVRMLWLVHVSAGLVAKSAPYERNFADRGSPRIFVFGDSTGVGTGVADPAGSVAGRFGEEFPQAMIRNLSVNGLRTQGLLESFPDAPADSYDLVLLQIGANDILQRTPLPNFEASLSAAFDEANRVGKHVVALHSGNVGNAPFFLWPLDRYFRARTLKVREVYQRVVAQKGVTYVDLFEEKENDPFTDRSFYAPDLLHLTEKGYGYWYAEIRSAMQRANIRL